MKTVSINADVKTDTDLQRLRKLAGTQYCNIYQMLKKNLKAIYSADLEVFDMTDSWGDKTGERMHLVIRYQNGSCKFPIESIQSRTNKWCPSNSNDEEIQNIFFNLLDIPVTTKQTA